MIAQELEVSLHMAFVEARQKRHEFITVEHLLLALLDNPSAAEVLQGLRGEHRRAAQAAHRLHHRAHAAPVAGTRGRHAAHAGLPARHPARHPARAVLRQEGSHRRQRAGRDLRREGFARGLLPAQQGVTRLDVVNYISHGITKSAAGPGKAEAAKEASGDEQQPGRRARDLHAEPEPAGARGQDRSADRPRARARARGADAVPPAQEQPAAGRRGRRRQDRDRRGPRAPHRRGQRARASSRECRSTRSTWARCSPAPSTAATSSSA